MVAWLRCGHTCILTPEATKISEPETSLDLELMADWAADSGMNFIQILPVNDTTMTRTNSDSYPIMPIPPLPYTRYICA